MVNAKMTLTNGVGMTNGRVKAGRNENHVGVEAVGDGQYHGPKCRQILCVGHWARQPTGPSNVHVEAQASATTALHGAASSGVKVAVIVPN